MDKHETINQLVTLLNDLELQRREKAILESAIKAKESLISLFRTRLEVFDSEHKAAYIEGKIGPEPVMPGGVLKLVVPVYIAKKKKYEKAIAGYREQYLLAEKAYCFDYQTERAELLRTADQEKTEAEAAAESEVQRANQAYQVVTNRVSSNPIVSDKYKTAEILSALIDYLCDGRADTLKEAINLWHDEEHKRIEMEKAEAHRAEILRLEQERLEAAQEAAEYQRLAYYAAQDAAESAREAADEAKRAADDVSYSVWSDYDSD